MKLLVINYMALPLPPVKGGAVEYLVDAFVRYNEEYHLHDIVLYSIYDEQAENASKAYRYTQFRYVKIENFVDKVDRIARHLINRIPNIYIGNTYIAKVLRREKNLAQYDAIIIENAPQFGLQVPKQYQNKLILHLHNDYLNADSKRAKDMFDCYREIYVISNHLGWCVQTIAQSDKVKTLYNGVDLCRFLPNHEMRKKMRETYQITEDSFVFMYCGRLVPGKGVLELVQAFSKLKGHDLRLILVGGDRYSSDAKTEYVKLVHAAADSRVIFTGFVPYEQMADLYSVPDVGVIPSTCNDSFNLTCVEFCASGVPVIISDRGAMYELVNERCSITACCDERFEEHLCNAMQEILDRKSELSDMGKEAQKVAKNYSIQRYCQNFNELLLSYQGEDK